MMRLRQRHNEEDSLSLSLSLVGKSQHVRLPIENELCGNCVTIAIDDKRCTGMSER